MDTALELYTLTCPSRYSTTFTENNWADSGSNSWNCFTLSMWEFPLRSFIFYHECLLRYFSVLIIYSKFSWNCKGGGGVTLRPSHGILVINSVFTKCKMFQTIYIFCLICGLVVLFFCYEYSWNYVHFGLNNNHSINRLIIQKYRYL